MIQTSKAAPQREVFEGRLERERLHYNKVVEQNTAASLKMSQWNIDRYRNPPANTEFSLEYAYHLLGPVTNKTIVDLGCGDGLNTTILASLGAHVIAVDISDMSLELAYRRAEANGVAERVRLIHSDAAGIPVHDNEADGVLCAAILHHVDFAETARHIRRILKSGGTAVFEEPMTGPKWICAVKKLLPKDPTVTDDERPLTLDDVRTVSEAVGRQGRSRYFGLLARLSLRFNLENFNTVKRIHKFDQWLLNGVAFAKRFASPLVWEVEKI
jgi:2-polyprenyl-3-methyl-5-hydroxy-6-metoxy-1,4-benzoquinol methylase